MLNIAIIVAVLAVLFAMLWKRESRSLLNAGVLGLLVAFTYLLAMEFAFRSGVSGRLYSYLVLALFVGLPVLYFVGSLLLVWNGRVVVRKEGVSLAHLLAPVVGGVPVILVFVILCALAIEHRAGDTASVIIGTLLTIAVLFYGYVLALAYCIILYGFVYTAFPRLKNPDAIIIHGSGLIHGNVTPLLMSRLDKAIDLYRDYGKNAILIPSGGQGDDEPRSEAEAMSQYLLGAGIPGDHIVPEDQSTSTCENLEFASLILERRGLQGAEAVFVTNNYHVFRTALLAREVGLNAHGVGSHTASYYLPSAMIREFIAIVLMYKWRFATPVILVALLSWILFIIDK